MIARTTFRLAVGSTRAVRCSASLGGFTKCRCASFFSVERPDSSGPPPVQAHKLPHKSLSELLDVLQSFRVESRRPTKTAYIRILDSLAEYALRRKQDLESGDQRALVWRIIISALRDAELGHVTLGGDHLVPLLKLSASFPDLRQAIYVEITSLSHIPAELWEEMCRIAILADNVEGLYTIIARMIENDMMPSEYVSRHAIRLACEWACPRLGLQLARWSEQHPEQGRTVETLSWLQLLVTSAENQFLEGVEMSWYRVNRAKSFTPDEGLVLTVLAVSARWGRPDLAVSALGVLPSISVVAGEHHLTPLLEAHVNAGQMSDAFRVLSSLRVAGVTPSIESAEPIVSRLDSPSAIDKAFFALEDMHRQGTMVDVSALNTVIKGSAILGDIKRARATQIAIPDFGLKPDIDTFNIVLGCCADGGYRQLGETIFSELSKAMSVTPNVDTFETMIRLCLGEDNYEDAFYYLEKMKAQGITPPRRVYSGLLETCVARRDRRWRLVIEEMERLGYTVDAPLRARMSTQTSRRDRT